MRIRMRIIACYLLIRVLDVFCNL